MLGKRYWLTASIVSCLIVAGVLLAVQYDSLIKTSAPPSSQQKNISGTIKAGSSITTGNHTLTVQARTASGKTVQASTNFRVNANSDPYKALIIYPTPRTAAQDSEVAGACRSLGDAANVFDIKQFGAKGDGSTDDYVAIRGAAAFISQPENAGKTLFYPPGDYKINQVINRNLIPSAAQADLLNIRYVNARNIKLIGCNATIDVKGDFDKKPRLFLAGNAWRSDLQQLSPFDFLNSSGFLVSGFEIKGNVDQMTRVKKVGRKVIDIVEEGGRGLSTSGCVGYVLENLNIHGFSTDGMFLGIGYGYKLDTNVTVRNVTTSGNGRQGLSIQQMRGATFTNVKFINTGRTGDYGIHSPGAGVDIEPIYCVSGCATSANRKAQGLADNTGDITFTNCTFADNLGAQFVSGGSLGTENVTIQNSTFNGLRSGAKASLGLEGKNGVIANNTFITAKTAILINDSTATVDIHDNRITLVTATYYGFPVIDIQAGRVTAKNNPITVTKTIPQ